MKRYWIPLVVVLGIAAIVIGQQAVTKIYYPPGEDRLCIGSGAQLDVLSGGELDIESGGGLELAGVSLDCTAAEYNQLCDVVGGTVSASKALVVGANKNLDHLRLDTSFYLVAHDTPPTTTEGYIYMDDSENAIKYYNGTSWIALTAGSGDNTLDNAYDEGGAGAGKKVEVDTGAIELEVDDTKNNPALHLDCDNTTNDPTALLIENAADAANAISIDIDAQSTGRDVEGTGATWHVTGAGVGTFSDVQTSTATITTTISSNTLQLANSQTITGDTNNEIEFTENGEEFSFGFTSNTITLATDTAIDALAFGVVDDLSGIGTIAFDAAASSMSLAAGGAAQDLTIQVTGAQNSSLILASAGTAVDALQINTTAGGIDISNGGAAGGEDTDISATNASVNISAAEDVADAIYLNASAGGIDITADGAAAKDLDLVCTNGSINLTAGESDGASIVITSSIGGIDIDAAGAAAGEDIDITATGSSVNITATEGDQAAIVLNASTAAGGIDITSNADIDITTTGEAAEDITITNTGGSTIIDATEDIADAIYLHATAGGIDITADGDAAKDLDLVCTNGSTNISGGEDVATAIVISAGAGGIDISATGEAAQDIDIVNTGGSVNVTATEDAAEAIYIRANGGTTETIKIHADQGDTASSIHLLSDAGGITLDAGADDDILLASDLDVDEKITGDGGAVITGMLLDVTDDTDGKTMTIAEAFGVETNAGAIGAGIWNLPEASTAIGMQYTFVCMAAQNMDINPDNGDQILAATNAAGDAIRSSTAGDTVTLVAVDATNWVVVAMYPASTDWADVN